MKTFGKLLMVAVILMIGVISCKKGDTGAAGPAGPAGPDSVVYSGWITLSFTQDVADTILVDTLIAPSVTQGILDSGIILSYINFPDPSTGVYHVTPSTFLYQYGLEEDYSPGKINLGSLQYDFTGLTYRYVSIPGSKKEGTSAVRTYHGYSAEELKALPYEQVQQIAAAGSSQ